MTNNTSKFNEALSKLDLKNNLLLQQVLVSQALSILLESEKVKEDLGMKVIQPIPKKLEVPSTSTTILKPTS